MKERQPRLDIKVFPLRGKLFSTEERALGGRSWSLGETTEATSAEAAGRGVLSRFTHWVRVGRLRFFHF